VTIANVVTEFILVKKILLNNSIDVKTLIVYGDGQKHNTSEKKFNKRIFKMLLDDIKRYQ